MTYWNYLEYSIFCELIIIIIIWLAESRSSPLLTLSVPDMRLHNYAVHHIICTYNIVVAITSLVKDEHKITISFDI